MEQRSEESPASETARVGRNEVNIPTSSNRTGISRVDNLDTVNDSCSNGGETTHRAQDVTLRNTGYHPNAFVVGCSRNNEQEINRDGKHSYQLSRNGPKNRTGDGNSMFEENSSSGIKDLKNISTHSTQGPSNITSNRSKPIYSSGFSKFFLGKSKAIAKDKNVGESREPCTKSVSLSCTPSVDHIRNVHGYSKKEAPIASGSSISSQLDSVDIVRKQTEMNNQEMNLREWLESYGPNASKMAQLQLFRLIVEKVDVLHCREIALLELRPSNFILLLDKGDVKYIGKSVEVELSILNREIWRKRRLEEGNSICDKFCVKMRKVDEDKTMRPETGNVSAFVNDKGALTRKCWLKCARLEKKWYDCPEAVDIRDLLSSNIYSLGLLLFEFLCHFESLEAHSEAMLDLHHRILPPSFLSEYPKEAGFCFWLLHPEPCSRPTTREILQSKTLYISFDTAPTHNEASFDDEISGDTKSDLLRHFLVSLKQQKQNKASDLLENVELLDIDIKEVEKRYTSRKIPDMRNGSLKHHRANGLREKLLENINQLENAYFCIKSNELTQIPDMDRPDKDILSYRDRFSWVRTPQISSTMEEKSSIDRVGNFFDGICKFARYNKFEVCGMLRNSDILNSNHVICSLSLDREEEHIAAAGVSKKIKIFEVASLLDDCVDVQYPVLEMSNNTKFSCICWNSYITNYLASTDYEGIVQIWDVSTGQGFAKYKEHQKRAWSVNFSPVDPTKFASGSDDCSIRIWNVNERNSVGALWNPANICCVQFSAYSSHLLAFGSADYRIYCYDLRHTKIPWCTLAGHGKAVSYVRFLDSETIVSASTDNTLKLWDLKKTSLEGLSPNACKLTFCGHTNEKNFVGLGVLDGYIACGSETNEVYAYYKSLPMPITTHKFGSVSGDEDTDSNGHFVSSLCWRKKTEMLVAANSSGGIKVLRMA